jgi:micrococcal nuclease
MSVRTVRRLVFATAAFFTLSAGSALAQPCSGRAPEPGQNFRGPVLYVEDGERICVALGATPDRWVPLVLADSPLQTISNSGADPRKALMASAFAQDVDCQVLDVVAGEIVAACSLSGAPLGRLMRQPATLAASSGWR